MLYPIIFKPIYKEVIWGGMEIFPFKGIPVDSEKIGESWEISHVEQHLSVVANGFLEGKTIDEIINEYGAQLLGTKVISQTGNTFPLLIKFIDACDNLSVQVHPDDDMALERHNSPGKTEIWYVVKATPDALLYCGFSQQTDIEEYKRRVEENSIMDIIKKYHIKEGDVFFLPAGSVHAIGMGCFILEIQQTSDITYRIYDYNRKDFNGYERELHTELAKDAINYNYSFDYKKEYSHVENGSTELVHCQYFTTNLLNLNKPTKRILTEIDSFIVYVCIKGKTTLTDNKGNIITIHQGQTVLIPADTENITITPEVIHKNNPAKNDHITVDTKNSFIEPNNECKLVEAYVK